MKNRIYKNNNENKAFDNPWTALKSEQIHFYPIFRTESRQSIGLPWQSTESCPPNSDPNSEPRSKVHIWSFGELSQHLLVLLLNF